MNFQVADAIDNYAGEGSSVRARLSDRLEHLRSVGAEIVATADRENRDVRVSEERDVKKLVEAMKATSARIKEVITEEKREMNAATVRKSQITGVRESGTYFRGGEHSYFLDRARSIRGDFSAVERLQRGAAETRVDLANSTEHRALNTTPGSGGEFSPPLWIVDEFITLARPGRPVADSLTNKPLPSGVSSLNIPGFVTGSTVADQGTQNTTLSNTDPQTDAVTDGVHTTAGFVVISQQDIDQSPISFDDMILQDLAADYARQMDLDVVTRMIANAGSTVTYTDGTPTTPKVNQQIAQSIITVHRGRHQPPDTVAMSPERWGRFLSYTDTQGRPLIVPSASGGGVNAFGQQTSVASEGKAGSLQGLDVIVDDLVPTAVGDGSDQDQALVYRSDDIWLYESLPVAEAMPQTYGNQLSVLCRMYRYYSMLIRYPKSIAVITGTGMIPPALGA